MIEITGETELYFCEKRDVLAPKEPPTFLWMTHRREEKNCVGVNVYKWSLVIDQYATYSTKFVGGDFSGKAGPPDWRIPVSSIRTVQVDTADKYDRSWQDIRGYALPYAGKRYENEDYLDYRLADDNTSLGGLASDNASKGTYVLYFYLNDGARLIIARRPATEKGAGRTTVSDFLKHQAAINTAIIGARGGPAKAKQKAIEESRYL